MGANLFISDEFPKYGCSETSPLEVVVDQVDEPHPRRVVTVHLSSKEAHDVVGSVIRAPTVLPGSGKVRVSL